MKNESEFQNTFIKLTFTLVHFTIFLSYDQFHQGSRAKSCFHACKMMKKNQ